MKVEGAHRMRTLQRIESGEVGPRTHTIQGLNAVPIMAGNMTILLR